MADNGDVVVPPSARQDDDRWNDTEEDVAMMRMTNVDDEPAPPVPVATPESRSEAAAAAAEMAVMDQIPGNANAAALAGAQAIMGATAEDGAVATFEAVDESGELVQQAFGLFLEQFKQQVETETPAPSTEENDDTENSTPPTTEEFTYIRPYHEQATRMAQNLHPQENDENSDEPPTTSRFSNTLFLNMQHVLQEDPELADALLGEFCRFEPYLRRAIQRFVLDLHPRLQARQTPPVFFIAVWNLPLTTSLRTLRTEAIGCLSSITGTVTRTSDVRPELLVGSFRCNKCGLVASKVAQQYHFTRPPLCRNPRCKNTSPMQFSLEIRQSEFVDWQKLRVQENSSQIPPGSMPRSMDIILRNEMVERCKAGDKCVFVGSLVVLPDASALARAGEAPLARKRGGGRPSDAATGGGGGVSGLKALGVRELTYRTCFVATSVLPAESLQQANRNESIVASMIFNATTAAGNGSSNAQEDQDPTSNAVIQGFTTAEREEIKAMRNSPRIYEQMVDSIAPSTFGHREVKKGLLLMLLGGIHKTTADGIKLRGDVNVCVIGDPSTAKSQFLKWVHSFWPNRTVYTSGKASSAAGLTAAVQRDQDTGEYCIEAGALMLADNGICCIDEFDKMDPTDQVAIHEAMEQQTISITKAGIQATLNARASILAAANPIYGRYDRSKTLKANVALSAPILSRFDLFFVVLDDCNPETDRHVARHILQVHRCEEKAAKPPFTKDQMRRYIKLARTVNPKLTPEAQRVMVDCYRKLRQGDTLGRSRSAYRITVRQLESMIRLSEGLARLYCADEIQPQYVREAYRLLKTSIIQVETNDVEVEEDDEEDEDEPMPPVVEETAEEEDMIDSQEESQPETQGMETQPLPFGHPGEYSGEPPSEGATTGPDDKKHTDTAPDTKESQPVTFKKKKKKKTTKISFEEYESITHAIAGHLRTLEGEDEANYVTWDTVLEWYLSEVEQDIGDSLERLDEMKKKVNLVIRRLIDVDRILVTVGDVPQGKKNQGKTLLAVHPNYEIA